MNLTCLRRLLAFLLLGIAPGVRAASEAPVPAPTTFARAAQPQLAVEGARVWLVFGRGDELFVVRSDDAGATFTTPVKIATVTPLALGMRRGPRLAVQGETLTVTAQKRGGDLFAFRSSDRGATWSSAVRINDTPASAREGLHALAAAPDGRLTAVWLDLRSGKMELYSATSLDGGATWPDNTRVYHSPDGTICECCHPSAVFDARGQLAVMWRNSIAGARDMWLSTQPRGATKFSPASKLGTDTWQLKGCPMDGGAVFPTQDGFATTWQRAGTVYVAAPGQSEHSLGAGKQPVAAPLAAGQLLVWQRDADLWSARLPGDAPPRLLLTNARFPSLAPLAGGSRVVLACEQGPDVTLRVLDSSALTP